jgi:uncharacterized protein YlxW (UPF0749 family)
VKKFISQLTIGLIFLLFGFMITTQMNMLEKQTASASDKQSPEILVENEQLKKQRDELMKKVNDLTKKNEEFETAAAGRTGEANLILQELQETRLRAGLSDVKGEGVTIYITPKANLFGNTIDSQPMYDVELLNIVNELNAVEAEAISINDIRLTNRSGIRTAGDAIIINNERISPKQRVTIKAIGSKKHLEGAMNFPGNIPERLTKNCEVIVETNDNIVIKKGQNTSKYEYAKQVD